MCIHPPTPIYIYIFAYIYIGLYISLYVYSWILMLPVVLCVTTETNSVNVTFHVNEKTLVVCSYVYCYFRNGSAVADHLMATSY